MIGPWQASRYLMAKDEHTVIRSSSFAALGVFLAEFTVIIGAVMVNAFNPDLTSDSNVMIWAAMNIMPTVLGVIMLTGVLAAGISSATTFLSLIGASVGNDIVEIIDDNKKVKVGRIAIIITSLIVLLLAWFNPPQIFWIMFLGATVIACSWFPVCIASIWSKRITKTGAFCGMLSGFIGCAGMKIISSVTNVTLPLFLDPFIVGLVMNILAMIIASSLTTISDNEKEIRNALFIIPESEMNPIEVAKSKKSLFNVVIVGIVISFLLIFLWVVPYLNAI
jgi:Na+/panthothenate symporter